MPRLDWTGLQYVMVTIFVLLMHSLQALSTVGSCLANVPSSLPLETSYANRFLPGQVFSLNDQCKMLYGPTAINCAVCGNSVVVFVE